MYTSDKLNNGKTPEELWGENITTFVGGILLPIKKLSYSSQII